MRERRLLVLTIATYLLITGIMPRIRALSAEQYPDDQSYYRSMAIVALESLLIVFALLRPEMGAAIPALARGLVELRRLVVNPRAEPRGLGLR